MTNTIERRLQRAEGRRGVSDDVARMSPGHRRAEIIRLHAAAVRSGEARPPPKPLRDMSGDEWRAFTAAELARVRKAVEAEGRGDAQLDNNQTEIKPGRPGP